MVRWTVHTVGTVTSSLLDTEGDEWMMEIFSNMQQRFGRQK